MGSVRPTRKKEVPVKVTGKNALRVATRKTTWRAGREERKTSAWRLRCPTRTKTHSPPPTEQRAASQRVVGAGDFAKGGSQKRRFQQRQLRLERLEKTIKDSFTARVKVCAPPAKAMEHTHTQRKTGMQVCRDDGTLVSVQTYLEDYRAAARWCVSVSVALRVLLDPAHHRCDQVFVLFSSSRG